MGKSHDLSSQATSEKAKPKPPAQTQQENTLFLPQEETLQAAAGASSPEDRLSNSLQRMPSEQLARQNLVAAQRLSGNTLAARAVQRINQETAPVQRHPPGASLLGGTMTAPGGGGEGGGPAPVPAGTNVEEGAETSAEPPTTETEAGAGAAPPEATTEPGAAPEEGRGTGGRAPATVSLPTLQTAYAQNAIQTAYGGVAGRSLITGTITIVPNMTALYREYDRICIENRVRNSDTGRVWAEGDKARRNRRRGLRTNAFAYEGSIWIDATQTDPTATVHEMLHVNTAPNFLENVGRAINEGITQRLAVRAVQATGHSVAGSEYTYVQEQRVVDALVGVIGEANIVNAYFNDPNIMINTYNTLIGTDAFAALKTTLNADSQAGYDAAVRILQPVSFEVKLALIQIYLDPLFGTPDVPRVERIISTCDTEEKFLLWIELEETLDQLDDFTRAYINSLLGMPETGTEATTELPAEVPPVTEPGTALA